MRVEDRIILAKLYSEQPTQLDNLPYSEDFERLAGEFNKGRVRPLDHSTIWRNLILIRKDGKLRKKGK